MVLLTVLLFIAGEIAAFVAVTDHIGLLKALVLLVLVSAIGPAIVRRVGLGAFAHTQERLARGELPTRDLLDGLVILIGGVMICVPGFISDAIGLLLMIGPVRHLLIKVGGHRLARRAQRAGPNRWTVISARSRPAGESRPSPPEHPPHELEPDDGPLN